MIWPPEPGEYFVVDEGASVAVCTLDDEIPIDVDGVCVFGRNRTENLGVERIVTNVVTNPKIRVLVVCGAEVKGHHSGQTIVALHANGLNERGKVVGSNGAIPIIQNIPREFVERFREQVEVVDLIGETSKETIEGKLKELASKKFEPFQGAELDFDSLLVEPEEVSDVPLSGETVLIAPEAGVSLDPVSGRIIVE